MKITYDPRADAVYIYLTEKVTEAETREADVDIALDFDVQERLVGIEVLAASERLDLDHLLPQVQLLGEEKALRWFTLRRELLRLKAGGKPVETLAQKSRNWIDEVGPDYVIVRPERGAGKPHRISAEEIENADTGKFIGPRRIIYALRELGGYPSIAA